jgi:hypothetical protein
MHRFQKNVVPLGRASVLRLAQRHCWKEKTLEVYWVSETSKNSSPKTDNQCPCI